MGEQVRIRYPFIVEQMEDGDGSLYWAAEVPDLPGCVATGETLEELFATVADAIDAWIETAKSLGEAIPEPSTLDKFSGRLHLRMPPTLHRRLHFLAKRNKTSLNSYINNLLHYCVGREDGSQWTYNITINTKGPNINATESSEPLLVRGRSVSDYQGRVVSSVYRR